MRGTTLEWQVIREGRLIQWLLSRCKQGPYIPLASELNPRAQ